ncbi:hypothetical protein HMI54_011266 [Coelomomyces lativittatus]|nr:hypothetical protein HMI54_011266 [Coelomomyces lativittatus]KAJ1511549.1 hypothetical protein HMI56_005251 [Coelomomyces lativittatus]KAJ1513988.1 hypothetical protein HMI55_005059 [Coelomomyces lativittatus]
MLSSSPFFSPSTNSPQPDSPSSLLDSLYSRLQTLEKCIYGSTVLETNLEQEQEHEQEKEDENIANLSIFKRGEILHQHLEKLEKDLPWVSQVLQKAPTFHYSSTSTESHRFINLPMSTFQDASKIPFDSKIGLIQLHVEDLENSKKEIQRIIDLEKELELAALEDLQQRHLEMAQIQIDAKNVEKAVKNVSDYVANLVKLYGEQINALSEIFLSMDFFLRLRKKTSRDPYYEI